MPQRMRSNATVETTPLENSLQDYETHIRSDYEVRARDDIAALNHLEKHYRAAWDAGENVSGGRAMVRALEKRASDLVNKIGSDRLRRIFDGRNRPFSKLVRKGEYAPWWPFNDKTGSGQPGAT
jgi:hypothetical protein